MKWSIIQLQKAREQGLLIDETVQLDGLSKRDNQIRDISPVHITGRTDISSEKVTFHLRITGCFILPCSRTLVDVPYPFDVETIETFLLKPSSEEIEDAYQVTGDTIDLTPVIEEILLLEIPIQVISEEAKHSELPSGKGWDMMTEDELEKSQKDSIDPRLASLAKFFDKEK
ncbi:uncharacterized protein J2S13_001625 [Oikeobacillus pervagus]|uniref:DUF177 domain-containing protein n=1 Tax=Oikeobacillus pervagus TaxID=1325931 RepID=A0AAJ1T5S0_9BACI|nr:YceD family protein [Oikeobacillus pervagus]MDQ0215225.1 uncharacterized protein [Oikeobacillus pervagus]